MNNENKKIIGYNPQTGEPIYEEKNINQNLNSANIATQSFQSEMNNNVIQNYEYQQSNNETYNQTNNQQMMNQQFRGQTSNINQINNNIANQQMMSNQMPLNQQYSIQSNYVNNQYDRLIRAYIGDNYDKITKNKFSIPAFFLNYFYTAYRKSYTLTIILLIILTILVPLGDVILYSIYIVVAICLGFSFNKMYLNYVKKEIDKIIKNNLNASENDLIQICANKGKPSVLISILSFIIYAIIVTVIRLLVITLIG